MANRGQELLRFYGGIIGSCMPFLILLTLIAYFSFTGHATIFAFWGAAWIALCAGLFLAIDKWKYCDAILEGLREQNGIVIVAAWLFAGVFGQILIHGGLVDGLLWFGKASGATGKYFALATFGAAMLLSLGTGTSTGTVIALAPVLFPAGILLGANPTIQALAILSGAAFGDNLSPISDTTIVSAFTQDAKIHDVVKSRLPLSISAAVIAGCIIFLTGGGELHNSTIWERGAHSDPKGLILLLSFVVIVGASLKRRHLLEALIYGNVSAFLLGLAIGKVYPSDLLHFSQKSNPSTGIIQNGISNVLGAVIFALLVLALAKILRESGLLDRVLEKLQQSVLSTVRQSELSIMIMSIITSIFVSANAAAELIVGPVFVQEIGKRFRLKPARRANIMDCSVCTIFYMLPWSIVVMVWFTTLNESAVEWGLSEISVRIAFLNPYPWALFIVLLISILTGWNRKLERD